MSLGQDDGSANEESLVAASLSRAEVLKRAAAIGLSVGFAGRMFASPALAGAQLEGATLHGVTWGGPWVQAATDVAKSWGKANVLWTLHQGGAAAILPKIEATWPHPQYDLVEVWSPVFVSMDQSGWLQPLSLEDPAMPNLKDIPRPYFYPAKGAVKTVPQSVSGAVWAYRSDLVKKPIRSPQDLLDPSLKGRIAFPDPSYSANLAIVSLALARGGNEHKMAPGWAFVKELAKAGNIVRAFNTESDVINSLTTGESAVAFANIGDFVTVAKHFPVKPLNRTPGFKGFPFVEGWVLLKHAPNAAEAKSFLNALISPTNDAAFNQATGEFPTNSKSKVPSSAYVYNYHPTELKKWAYFPDWGYLSRQADAWLKRWENEIAPLL
jgi:spermidine/putrescine-binding protein